MWAPRPPGTPGTRQALQQASQFAQQAGGAIASFDVNQLQQLPAQLQGVVEQVGQACDTTIGN